MTTLRILALLFALATPAGAFDGRGINDPVPTLQVIERCANSWDIPPTGYARACSWVSKDSLNPGCWVCHIIYPNDINSDWANNLYQVELSNCDTEERCATEGLPPWC